MAAARLVPTPLRGVLLLLVLALTASLNVSEARQQQAFNLSRYEARYRTMGRYLQATLPPGAVIVAAQESGSASYYAGLPVLRWDLLQGGAQLDDVVAQLGVLGRSPVLLVEDWEAEALRRRFPRSVLARLDWQPRADVGSETRVRLFDVTDRDGISPVTTDRFR